MWRRLISVLIWLAFLFLVGVEAQGQYKRPTTDPPTSSDLLTYDGQEKTVIVQLVNLTPYPIQLKNTSLDALAPSPSSTSITDADKANMLNRDRDYNKSFMFAPLGIPRTIPGAPLQAFEPQYLDENKTPNPDYIPGWKNTETRPYTMVFSWDDFGGVRADNWLKWTVKGVVYCTDWRQPDPTVKGKCYAEGTRDVDLGLWMYRIAQHPSSVNTKFLPPLLKSYLTVIMETLGIVSDPINPIAWVLEFLAVDELADSIKEAKFEDENKEPNVGNKLYLASYAVPDDTSFCSTHTDQDCTPSKMTPAETGDAVSSVWDPRGAGPCPWGCSFYGDGPLTAAEANLVVTVHVFRGHQGPPCSSNNLQYCKDSYSCNISCSLGSLPMYMITVMRDEEYGTGGVGSYALTSEAASEETLTPAERRVRLFLLQAGAGSIRALLRQYDRSTALPVLRSVVQNLDATERQVLRQMVQDMMAGNRPTKSERDLVHLIATRLRALLK